MKINYRPAFGLAFAVLAVAVAVFFGFAPSDPMHLGLAVMANVAAAAPEAQINEIKQQVSAVVTSLKTYVEEHKSKFSNFDEMRVRLQDVEQKLAHNPNGGGLGGEANNAGAELMSMITKSDGLAAFQKGITRAVEIPVPARLLKTAIINAQGQNQPLVAADRRPGIVVSPERRLTIRDLFVSVPTSSNLVEFSKEETFTNNAGQQFSSPNDVENVLKNESAMTFSLANVAVATIAHWIPASRQILDDAPALQQHIENRLLYGLKLKEETQLLLGDGSAGNLSGLSTLATLYNRGVSNDTMLDALAKAILQLILSGYEPSGIILNPADWFAIRLSKDNQGRYLFGNPQDSAAARLWGLPVVATNSMTSGQFIVLDALRSGYIADREDAMVRIAEQHDDFFVRNMVAILCEERMAFVCTQAGAIVKGTLPPAGT